MRTLFSCCFFTKLKYDGNLRYVLYERSFIVANKRQPIKLEKESVKCQERVNKEK